MNNFILSIFCLTISTSMMGAGAGAGAATSSTPSTTHTPLDASETKSKAAQQLRAEIDLIRALGGNPVMLELELAKLSPSPTAVTPEEIKTEAAVAMNWTDIENNYYDVLALLTQYIQNGMSAEDDSYVTTDFWNQNIKNIIIRALKSLNNTDANLQNIWKEGNAFFSATEENKNLAEAMQTYGDYMVAKKRSAAAAELADRQKAYQAAKAIYKKNFKEQYDRWISVAEPLINLYFSIFFTKKATFTDAARQRNLVKPEQLLTPPYATDLLDQQM